MTTLPLQGSAATAVERATTAALETVRRNIAAFGADYPDDTTRDGRYEPRPAVHGFPRGGNRGWTTSFFSGVEWLAWQLSGDDLFRDAALAHAADFSRRVRSGEDLDTHDLGFLYSLSTVPAWRLLDDEDARQAALLAAKHLMLRYLEPAGIIQAWGDLSDPKQRGRTIVDSLMNMPLLTWAGEQTGDERYPAAV
jgi:unsaturated chondroitin disaccharide hydrolase